MSSVLFGYARLPSRNQRKRESKDKKEERGGRREDTTIELHAYPEVDHEEGEEEHHHCAS